MLLLVNQSKRGICGREQDINKIKEEGKLENILRKPNPKPIKFQQKNKTSMYLIFPFSLFYSYTTKAI